MTDRYTNPIFNSLPEDVLQQPEEISLAWRNLIIDIKSRSLWPILSSTTKTIVRGSSGALKWNSMTGLLGPSGAGKTTLLKALCGEIHRGVSGEIFRDGRSKLSLGYIEQDTNQTMMTKLTVGETLKYAFQFKNPNVNVVQMWEHIDATIKELALDSEILGRLVCHCSGGEQKRVAVAQELMALERPSLLFLDEPTTGLDSTAALLLIQCLKSLSHVHHMSIILSIHQPSDQILQLFDQIHILARGGLTIYSGPPLHLASTLQEALGIQVNRDTPAVEEFLRIACDEVTNSKLLQFAQKQSSFQLPAYLEPQPYGLQTPLPPFKLSHLITQITRFTRVNFLGERRLLVTQISLLSIFFLTLSQLFGSDMQRSSGCALVESRNSSICEDDLDLNALEYSYIFYTALTFVCISISGLVQGVCFLGPFVTVFRNEHRNRRIEREKFRRTELMEGTSSMSASGSSKEPDGQVVISGLTTDGHNQPSLESELEAARARIRAHSALYDDLGLVIAVFVISVLVLMIAFNLAFAYLIN